MHTEPHHEIELASEKKSGLAYWAARVLEECDKASHDFAADPVHDLRVAIRRCRSMADGFLSVDPDPAWRQMKKLGKGLFASLGELRDTQVMIEWVSKLSADDDPLRQILLDSLQQKEEALKLVAREAVTKFDRKRWTALNTRLAERAVPFATLLRCNIFIASISSRTRSFAGSATGSRRRRTPRPPAGHPLRSRRSRSVPSRARAAA